MSKIILSSLNVRGLVTNDKRREIFQWLKKKKLFNLHVTRGSFKQRTPLGFGWLNGATQPYLAARQATKQVSLFFLTTIFSFKILKQFCDKEGRCIIIDLEVGELTLTICNIYAPNKDDPAFFEVVFKEMLSFRCDEIIFGGDLNLVLDILKDKRGAYQPHIRTL